MTSQKEIWDKEYELGRRWGRETITLPKILKGKKVLELGVGNGKTLSAIIKQKPKEVFAVDFSSKAIEECKKKYSSYYNISYINGDVLKEEFLPNSLDVVVCYYFLNNISLKDRKILFDKIRRWLKVSGKILFEDFAEGDMRAKGKITEENNTFVNQKGILCHFFSIAEIKELSREMKVLKLKKEKRKPFRGKENERCTILAIMEK